MVEFGLIGKKLSHSFSKDYFSKKFMKLGLSNYTYELFPLADISQLTNLIKDHSELKGLNVTIPYKQEILPYLNSVDPTAEAVGAVNVVKIERGELIGYNSDFLGFKQSLEQWLPGKHKFKALILGTGGASKAVAAALQSMDIPFQYVSRTNSATAISYNTLKLNSDYIKGFNLIINTTPLGMSPNTEEYPDIPYSELTANHFLYDLIYNPEETQFLLHGKTMGCNTKNGLEMLHIQAEKSWEIWNS
ncbi:shikimate dehydrogenase family protein [Fulvivirga sediminis]|uniref:Shikimate dehydrogenase n=1 Tax=Fulvivirga sediminis TaxID=2803949 RepID=A0A937F736_9BACT|nr:shikimate dehydrogenase [Fulvivirga sediminis]MBL3656242.1 shikimate dehydrogenase [Fulvivirga sediminis]